MYECDRFFQGWDNSHTQIPTLKVTKIARKHDIAAKHAKRQQQIQQVKGRNTLTRNTWNDF